MPLTASERKRRKHKYYNDPEYRAKVIRRSREHYARIRQDPEWQDKLRAKGREAGQRFRKTEAYKACKLRQYARQKTRWRTDPIYRRKRLERMKDDRLKSRYGITVSEYNEMFRRQDGVCLLCLKPPKGGPRRLVVDHCHITGRVRGLLHASCNTLLGAVGDSADALRAAADRLERGGLSPKDAAA